MKHLVVTDTHLGIYSASDLWHNITINLFKEIQSYGIKHNIKSLLHLGDFFHNRKETNTKTLDIAQFIMVELLHDFKINMVIGNHDCYYKNKLYPNSLQIFRENSHMRIIGEPYILPEDENIIMCPWSGDFTSMPIDKYLLGHFEIKGFTMNSSYKCKHGVEKKTFKSFKHIYSGHFHCRSSKYNITYLGSPYGQTWHDVNAVRGFHVFDSDSGKLDFVEYTKAPKFIVVGTENINEEEVKGNFIKLLFQKDYGHIKNQKIVDEVSNMKPLSLQTDYSQVDFMGTEEKQSSETLEIMDHGDIIKEYIEKIEIPEHMQKQTLLGFMEKLMI